MGKSDEHVCGAAGTLIFACSGGADVGEISDQAGRQLSAEGTGKMFCLAGVGGGVEAILETTRQATKILAIDGCPVDCTKKTLEAAGFKEFAHLRVTDCGMEKGHAPLTGERVSKVAGKAKRMLKA